MKLFAQLIFAALLVTVFSVAIGELATIAVVKNTEYNTQLKLEQGNNHIHNYDLTYYEIICSSHGRIDLHDWSDSDLSVYDDGRVEYASVTFNRTVTFYFATGTCKSIPPIVSVEQ